MENFTIKELTERLEHAEYVISKLDCMYNDLTKGGWSDEAEQYWNEYYTDDDRPY